MQAFLAILRYDVGQLAHSWVVRIWLALLIVPAIFLVVVAGSEDELASETLYVYMAAVLAPLSALAVSVIAVGAVSGENAVLADSILSRSVTRTEYISAKIVARIGTTMAVYLAVVLPFAYLTARYAVRDTSVGGVTIGLLMVAVMLVFLAALGIALSTVARNVLLAVLALLLVVIFSGVALQFLGLTWMSTTAVITALPETFRGETPVWDEVRVLAAFTALTAASIAASLWLFRTRDL